jgi:hypothetical protein
MLNFQLHAGQAPDYPQNPTWPDALRWLLCSMNRDDKALPFVASLFAYALEHKGALTQRQASAAQNILNRVSKLHDIGALDCQVAVPGFERVDP